MSSHNIPRNGQSLPKDFLKYFQRLGNLLLWRLRMDGMVGLMDRCSNAFAGVFVMMQESILSKKIRLPTVCFFICGLAPSETKM